MFCYHHNLNVKCFPYSAGLSKGQLWMQSLTAMWSFNPRTSFKRDLLSLRSESDKPVTHWARRVVPRPPAITAFMHQLFLLITLTEEAACADFTGTYQQNRNSWLRWTAPNQFLQERVCFQSFCSQDTCLLSCLTYRCQRSRYEL